MNINYFNNELHPRVVAFTTFAEPNDFSPLKDHCYERLIKNNVRLDVDWIKDNLKKIDSNLKGYILIYLYINNSRDKHSRMEGFISLKKLREILEMNNAEENRILTSEIIQGRGTCPSCQQVVPLTFINLKKPQIQKQVCGKCGHVIGPSIYAECSCDNCSNIFKSVSYFFNHYQEIFEQLAIRIIEKNAEPINNIPEERLKFFANKYSSDLSKTEREIIAYRPQQFSEIREVVSNYKEFQKVLALLKEHKVVVSKRVPFTVQEMKEYLVDYYFCSGSGIVKSFSFYGVRHDGWSGTWAKNFIDFENVKFSSITWKKNYNLSHIDLVVDMKESTNSYTYQELLIRFYTHIFKDPYSISPWKEVEELNPYYFTDQEFPVSQFYSPLVNNLFRSDKEKKQFEFLKLKHPNLTIAVNKHLRDVIHLEKIRSQEDDEGYLKRCVLDFVLYNKEGVPVKVIELQRGEHHNSPLYIKRDRLKKEAVLMAGIEYEEIF